MAMKKTKMMKGGATAKAVNAGASVKPAQKGTPKTTMMKGGMAKKKNCK